MIVMLSCNMPLAESELKDYAEGWNSQPYEYDYYVDKAYVRAEGLKFAVVRGSGPPELPSFEYAG